MADTETVPKPPPNLRVAEGEDKECGDCKHYMPGDMCGCCKLYGNLPVQDEWVCDSWAKNPKGDADADEDMQDESPAKNVRQAEQNARGRFRAARRQQASVSNDGKPQ